MEYNQHQLLIDLAKRLKKQKKSREKIIAGLIEAKILDKKENFTKPYADLGRAISNGK